jgi:hypothetical protein
MKFLKHILNLLCNDKCPKHGAVDCDGRCANREKHSCHDCCRQYVSRRREKLDNKADVSIVIADTKQKRHSANALWRFL